MKKILIADASKASLVMTSEVFKDHFPGVQVLVARTSAEALEIAKSEQQIDAFVVDFDLPDKDGAYTAAKIKKLFPIPVLITAFDRPDVQETIEKLCSAYDDCLSWLAKPVNSELVVSIAQRFIEGNYRTQRRIDCLIPGVAEVQIRSRNSAKKSKGAEQTQSAASEAKICLPVMLEDCSVGGFKFRIMKKDLTANKEFQFTNDGRLNIHETLTIFVPSFENIQTGEENVGYWLWDENRENKGSGPKLDNRNAPSKSASLSAIKRTTRQNLGSKSHEGQAIHGRSIWTTQVDGGDALIGVRSDNMVLSKKLFEAILLGDNKIQARKAQLETQRERQKELAAARANAPARPQIEIISGSFTKSLPVAPQVMVTVDDNETSSAKVIPISAAKVPTEAKSKKALAPQPAATNIPHKGSMETKTPEKKAADKKAAPQETIKAKMPLKKPAVTLVKPQSASTKAATKLTAKAAPKAKTKLTAKAATKVTAKKAERTVVSKSVAPKSSAAATAASKNKKAPKGASPPKKSKAAVSAPARSKAAKPQKSIASTKKKTSPKKRSSRAS